MAQASRPARADHVRLTRASPRFRLKRRPSPAATLSATRRRICRAGKAPPRSRRTPRPSAARPTRPLLSRTPPGGPSSVWLTPNPSRKLACDSDSRRPKAAASPRSIAATAALTRADSLATCAAAPGEFRTALYRSRAAPDFSARTPLSATRNAQSRGIGTCRTASWLKTHQRRVPCPRSQCGRVIHPAPARAHELLAVRQNLHQFFERRAPCVRTQQRQRECHDQRRRRGKPGRRRAGPKSPLHRCRAPRPTCAPPPAPPRAGSFPNRPPSRRSRSLPPFEFARSIRRLAPRTNRAGPAPRLERHFHALAQRHGQHRQIRDNRCARRSD